MVAVIGGMMERMRGWVGVYGGGCFSYFRAANQTTIKFSKIKYDEGLRWPPFDILHATTNQKHAGVMEGGWDRPHNHARRLGERDGKLRATKTTTTSTARMVTSPTTTANTPLALTVSASPLTRVTTSAAPAQACPASQRPSVPSC